MKPWSESIRAEALTEGQAKGQVRILVSQARRKFGD